MMSSPGRTAEAVGDCAARAAAAPPPELTQGTATSGPDSRRAPLGSRIRQRGPRCQWQQRTSAFSFSCFASTQGRGQKDVCI